MILNIPFPHMLKMITTASAINASSQLFDALEADEWCREADRVWLTSSVNALDFYEKRGYVNPNGYRARGDDGLLTMEKRKNR